jgi:hypothetical protein
MNRHGDGAVMPDDGTSARSGKAGAVDPCGQASGAAAA